MNISTPALRSRLRGLSATLQDIDDEQRTLRDEQLEQLRIALAHCGTIKEASEASGLSRAYLHRIEMHLHRGPTPAPATHSGALARAAEIRARLEQLGQASADIRAQRDDAIRDLAKSLNDEEGKGSAARRRANLSAEIASDAGLTAERVRIILQAAGPTA